MKHKGIQTRDRRLFVRVKLPVKGWWWIKALSLDGTRTLRPGEEDEAAEFRRRTQELIEAGEELGLEGDYSVAAYARRRFVPYQKLRIKSWKDDEDRLRLWALPHLGKMQMSDVRARHVNDVVQRARAAKKASRTVRNIYSAMQGLFRLACLDGLIQHTPCILTRAELGKKQDKVKGWRSQAIFSRDELVKLISSPLVPRDRRVFWALLGLGMLRHGEAAGVRWKHLLKLEPLSRLVVATSYDTGDTKTGVERWMPVHQVLGAMLAEWKLVGWRQEYGRAPGAEDLIVPTPKPTNRGPRVPKGIVRDEHYSWKRLKKDLTALGLRRRRQHDLRRTGITLARDGGAERDILRLCTHQPPDDVMESYTTFSWAKLCAQVDCLKIERPRPGAEGTGA